MCFIISLMYGTNECEIISYVGFVEVQNGTFKIDKTQEISLIGFNTYFTKKNHLFIEMQISIH